MRSVMPCMSQETLKMVHQSCFHAIMNYISIFWGNTPHGMNMFRMQKHIIRIIMGHIIGDLWRDLFKKRRTLPLQRKCALPRLLFIVSNMAGPRLVGARGRPLNWRPLKPIFSKFLTQNRAGEYYQGMCPSCESFSENFFRMWKTRFYQQRISNYSSDVLAPLTGWRPGQLPGWLAPQSGPGQ